MNVRRPAGFVVAVLAMGVLPSACVFTSRPIIPFDDVPTVPDAVLDTGQIGRAEDAARADVPLPPDEDPCTAVGDGGGDAGFQLTDGRSCEPGDAATDVASEGIPVTDAADVPPG